MYSESRAGPCHDLLLFCACKLSKNCLCYRRGRLDGQRVHEHARSGRHDAEVDAGRCNPPLKVFLSAHTADLHLSDDVVSPPHVKSW